ncbi:putative pectate lyase 22, partial [Silene latifolia]|uniref:putative pectate lyase 22 n=1 Tax=Silene latifolia TaxID=37657 RepID=UPI003D782AF8
ICRDLELCRNNLTGNPIDDCWRYDRHWAKNRQDLAKCSIGFGRRAKGGFNGSIYVVTDPRDDRHNPQVGTLRYGAMQDRPLWIVFARDMSIKLEYQLQINSFKTIDGRGAKVTISSSVSTCLDMTNVTNVIIHGLRVHDCSEDGMTVTNSSHIWIDHCSLSRCGDGLLDVVHGSTMVTISNNYLTHHNKVMLLGNSDENVDDKKMRVTVAFNHFGEGLNQRLPRCRFGVFHIVNNHYTHWLTYAIGGSSAPTIYSQGNRFLNSDVLASKTQKRNGKHGIGDLKAIYF